jgi:HK97 family phage major capsid protein/HK97 family phage prohead protease
MPTPHPQTESKDEWMDRCIPAVIDDGAAADTEQAVAMCSSMWEDSAKSAIAVDRAYALINIKSVADEQRTITGTATTPEPDRLGDIVEPLGVSFKNPLPLLWQHRAAEPVGTATFAKPTKDGISFTARLAKVDEPGRLKDRIDEAWQSIKAGLVRGVSIGFRARETSMMKDGGIRFIKSEVLELSLVTVPANASTTIATIRSLAAAPTAPGHKANGNAHSPGVTGSSKPRTPKGAKAMTILEQIEAFEKQRKSKFERMNDMMQKAADAGETLAPEANDEYDGLERELGGIDAHLKRLRELEARNVAQATPLDNVTTIARASEARSSYPVIRVKANVPPGTAFVRRLIAETRNVMGWDRRHPADIAKAEPAWHNTPEVEMYLRAAVDAGTTTHATWAAPLVEPTNLTSEFAEMLRMASIIGRIPGIRRVPFNIKVPRQTGSSTVNWIGETRVKPVSALVFDQITLTHTKVAGIVIISEELLRFSNPAAEEIIRNDLRDKITELVDHDFLDPTLAEQTGVRPASITNGVTPINASGTNADALRADLGDLLAEFLGDNMDLGSLVLVMKQDQAMRISLMVNTLGTPEFPGMTRDGGTLVGIPVIASQNIVDSGGSPTDGSLIVAINARDILLADDGAVTVDASREASVQMDSSPDSPSTGSTNLVSLWQHNLVGLRAERMINFKKRRSTAVNYIQFAKYE